MSSFFNFDAIIPDAIMDVEDDDFDYEDANIEGKYFLLILWRVCLSIKSYE